MWSLRSDGFWSLKGRNGLLGMDGSSLGLASFTKEEVKLREEVEEAID